MELETWRPIPGYEGSYSVSDIGRIRRDARSKGTRAGRILNPGVKGGYRVVALHVNGVPRPLRVHRLVALAFVGAPARADSLVRHLDGDSLNNCASNLAYGSHHDNKQDELRHGRNFQSNKTECSNGHLYTPQNTYIRPDGARDCRVCRRLRKAKHRRRVQDAGFRRT